MDIHREEFGMEPRYWHRVTDGCQGEFKSLKTTLRLAASPQTVLNLPKSDKDYFVTWNYFESHEGKSRSDGIGALVKTTLEKAIRKRPGTIVTRASEAVTIIRYKITGVADLKVNIKRNDRTPKIENICRMFLRLV